MDVEFKAKLYDFADRFERDHNTFISRLFPGGAWESVGLDETGYKFVKVFVNDGNGVGRYMVELSTGDIYGVKSWNQVNLRWRYGNLDTIEEFDWSAPRARPIPGTQAEQDFYDREAAIQSNYKKRGPKKKSKKLRNAKVQIPWGTFKD